ncbi:PREDICTED: hypermethylated in cancer 2 protein [Bison bison bison]|uniref:Hypermethylated in cancer 1 protein n=1 Tax=Bison bison bison TaxID=43346 RepID=A0A6P3H9F6_BISBB|nr:PREDICTED: hypermethylated in cancer 2 protein [Bison bison bison]
MVSGPLALRWCVWAGRGDMGPDMELPSHSKQLLLQLNQQRTQGFLCDVIVMVENAVFRAHKNVLAASSVYFKSLVLHDNLISLDTDMVSSAVFQQILDFIYTGRLLPGEPPAEPNFSTLLTAASYLQLPELAALCRRKLKRAGKPFGSGRGGAGLGRHPRSQRLSTASVIQTRYPGLVDGRKGAHAPQELSQAKGSDDELFLGGLSQEGAHGLGRPVCPGSGEAGLGGCSTNGAGGSCEQELGLDLSKKSRRAGEQLPRAHKNVLAASSVYFKSLVLHDNLISLDTDMVSSAVFQQILDFIYTGRLLPGEPPAEPNFSTLLTAASYLQLPELAVAAGAAGLGPPFGGGGDKVAGAPGGLGELLRPYRCASCDKSYKDPATLRQHEKTHWLARPFPCGICGKMFTQRGTMTRHMRSHLGLKPFACGECGMRFTRQYRLTEHMRIHSGEKPYECQLCGGKFTQQRNLISHLRMHTAPS